MARDSFWHRRSGMALLEFALTSVIGLTLLLSSLGLGYRYMMQARFDDAAREVTRLCLARAGLPDACKNIKEVRRMVYENLKGSFDEERIMAYGRSYKDIKKAVIGHKPGDIFEQVADEDDERRALVNKSRLNKGPFVAYELDYDLAMPIAFVPDGLWDLRSYVIIYNEGE
ncbi:MAG: hypothetical protein GDA54_04575 [Alphaproteobacteria bacterium GM7ARS4]|nr:hypothetical protein [Alphaproteobacteria bacterium GM7ARS4]